ncbi:MAG: Transcriptional regulator [uncultured bacterium]|nr:MAG: Transcriptional regulator [uncultured bacterium]
MKKSTICQSCGMPMKKEDDFGTNNDKSPNNFTHGKFTDEGISLEDKIKKIIEFAKKMGIDEKEAKVKANSTIAKLKRWRIK